MNPFLKTTWERTKAENAGLEIWPRIEDTDPVAAEISREFSTEFGTVIDVSQYTPEDSNL